MSAQILPVITTFTKKQPSRHKTKCAAETFPPGTTRADTPPRLTNFQRVPVAIPSSRREPFRRRSAQKRLPRRKTLPSQQVKLPAAIPNSDFFILPQTSHQANLTQKQNHKLSKRRPTLNAEIYVIQANNKCQPQSGG